jgi:transcriptional regulator with XRE-family HTH domain
MASKPSLKMLGVLLRAWRENSSIGLRDAARRIGISHSTLSRIERGEATDGHTLWLVLNWLNTPVGGVPK